MVKPETLYLDDKHNIVSENKATWKVIHEYDSKGELEKEVWVDLKLAEEK